MTTATASAATSLGELLSERASRDAISGFLDGLSDADRVAQALSLGGKQVGALYQAMADGPALTLEHFVPSSTAEGKTVIWDGRNSLPAFSSFQKRFARVQSGQIVGYNHQTMAFATGPGFFVVRPGSDDADVPGELYFDYTSKPDDTPSGWPAYKPNDRGISNLVYKNMKDYMRSVAKNVVVGEAYKLGKSQKQFFILCRK